MERLKENLEALKMKNTLETLDNYLERAVKDNLNIVEVLDHIFMEEAHNKRKRAYSDRKISAERFEFVHASSTNEAPFLPQAKIVRKAITDVWIPNKKDVGSL